MRITAEQALARLTARRPSGMRKNRSAADPVLLRTVKETGDARVYVFNDNGAGVIAPADDTLPAVIGNFRPGEEGEEIPPSLVWWLSEYAREIKMYQDEEAATPEEEEEEPSAPPSYDNPGLLGDIMWNQLGPWNNKLVFGGRKCYTGCPCTAVAQVVYYWAKKGRRRGCIATTAYTSKKTDSKTNTTYQYQVAATPEVEMFDFANMADSDNGSLTDVQKNAMSEFCAHISKAFKTNFSPSSNVGSSAPTANVKYVMETCFRLGNVDFYDKPGAVKLNGVVLPQVQQAIASGIPVIMVGSGGGCHCFICDGYDADSDTYHFNFGYGGKFDGWMAMSAIRAYGDHSQRKCFHILQNVPPLLGDVNMDGKINMSDVSEVIHGMTMAETQAQTYQKRTGAQVRAVRAPGAGSVDGCVDLGLPSGTLWADRNVGATTPSGYGGYFAWGETTAKTTKKAFDWKRYKYYDATTKKAIDIGSSIVGTQYDAAKAVMGSGWQMPTAAQWKELQECCTVRIVNDLGIGAVCEIKRNGKTLILPVAGCVYNADYPEPYKDSLAVNAGKDGYYWTGDAADDVNKAASVKLTRLPVSTAGFSTYSLSDVNFDGVVDDKDVQLITDRILGKDVL